MEFIKIDGLALPAPSNYEILKHDIESGDKSVSETGILHRSVVRSGIYSIKLDWLVSESQLKDIINALFEDSFTVEFFDPVLDSGDSGKNCLMYCKERSFSCIGFDVDESWWKLSVCLAEY